jgi:hypothetical protein
MIYSFFCHLTTQFELYLLWYEIFTSEQHKKYECLSFRDRCQSQTTSSKMSNWPETPLSTNVSIQHSFSYLIRPIVTVHLEKHHKVI